MTKKYNDSDSDSDGGSGEFFAVGISMVKNEADVIEVFVRTNLRILDALVILDNKSSDATRAILIRLIGEGLPIVVLDDPDPMYDQSRKMTDLLYVTARAMNPKWVIPLDADEMLLSVCGEDFRKSLRGLPKNSIGLLYWRTYVPTDADEDGDVNVLTRITHRRFSEKNDIYKIAIPRDIYEKSPVIVAQGNHALLSEGGGYHRSQRLSQFFIAHYPVRSRNQVIGKAIIGWLAHLSNPKRKEGQGHQWEAIYNEYFDLGGISDERFFSLGKDYANGCTGGLIQDPFPVSSDVKVKYAEMQVDNTEIKVARFAEELAVRIGENPLRSKICQLPNVKSFGLPENSGRPWADLLNDMSVSCDVAPIRYLKDLFEPASVLQIGRGTGAYLQLFENWGVKTVLGMEIGRTDSGPFVPGMVRHHDPSQSIDLAQKFDLVICNELMEMTRSQYLVLLSGIDKHSSQAVLFVPGRVLDDAHRSHEAWVDIWREMGWHYLAFQTLGFRLSASIQAMQRDSLLFVRQGHILLKTPLINSDIYRPVNTDLSSSFSPINGYFPVTFMERNSFIEGALGKSNSAIHVKFVRMLQRLVGTGSNPLQLWIRNRIARIFGM